jgi:hypothetical protein
VDTDTETEARRHLRRVRIWAWSAAALVVIVAVIVFAVVHSSNDKNNGDAASDYRIAANSNVLVTLDDHGIHAAPTTTTAGVIQFGLSDKRTKPTGDAVQLFYEQAPGVGGDLITGAGGQVRVLLCPQTWYLAVRVDNVLKGRIPFPVTGNSSLCTKQNG